MFTSKPIIPKNSDGICRIISIGRLSKPKETAEATQQSLEAIRKENERMLNLIYSGETEVRYLAEQISGMVPTRLSMEELWQLVESGEWDLIIAEDLSRIFRNPRWQLAFLQDCVDAGIRVICFADNLDTADENWESLALFAATRHGMAIPDQRRRNNRTATESFKRGGMVMKNKGFYAKVSREDAAAGTYGPKGLRIRRLVELAWVVDEIRRRLHDGHSPPSIVAWLKAEGIPCGPYAEEWTVQLFRELMRDPVLHGTRTFRDVKYKQIFRTGNFERKKNATPDMEYIPELAFMTREEQEEMLAAVGWSIDWGGIRPTSKPHPRKGVSRDDAYWPAQSATCNVCGGKAYACGKFMRCSNSFPHLDGECWNHVQAPIWPLRNAVAMWLLSRCQASEPFRVQLLEAVKQQLALQQSRGKSDRDVLDAKIKDLEAQERNLRKSIRFAKDFSDEDLEGLVGDLAEVAKQLKLARSQRASADSSDELFRDYSDNEIVEHIEEVLMHLLATSFEMNEVMRLFVPQCLIVPVQALDTGQVYPRAKLTVRGHVEDYERLDELVVDLFEPSAHIRFMPDAVKLRAQIPQPTYKQIGAALGTSYMTVKRALGYARRMQELGIQEPFRELTEKPESASRWRHAS